MTGSRPTLIWIKSPEPPRFWVFSSGKRWRFVGASSFPGGMSGLESKTKSGRLLLTELLKKWGLFVRMKIGVCGCMWWRLWCVVGSLPASSSPSSAQATLRCFWLGGYTRPIRPKLDPPTTTSPHLLPPQRPPRHPENYPGHPPLTTNCYKLHRFEASTSYASRIHTFWKHSQVEGRIRGLEIFSY